MKYVKLFESFVNEGAAGFTDQLLAALDPTIIQIAERIKADIANDWEQKTGKEKIFTEFDERMIRLSLIIDLLKSFQNYVYDTDRLASIKPYEGSKGIEISAVIERDGQQYNYFTEAIYAGGYNIQRLHLRYLTKTNMPRITKNDLARDYEIQYKNLSKAEKLNAEIQKLEDRIADTNAKLAENLSKTDEQILQIVKDKRGEWPTWQQIIKNGAAKNYNNDEAEYIRQIIEMDQDRVKTWKMINIDSNQRFLKTLEKELAKTRAKLEKVL